MAELETPWMTLEEAAAYLSTTKTHLGQLVRRKAIPHSRVGRLIRLHRGELDKWLSQETVGGPVPRIVVKSEEPVETNEKRFYLSDNMIEKLKCRCPECGEITHLTVDYLSFPTAGMFDKYTVHCGNEKCYHTWEVRGRLDFVFTLEDKTAVTNTD